MQNNIKRAVMLMVSLSITPMVYATGDGFYMGAQLGSANLNNVAASVLSGLNPPPPPANCHVSNSHVICDDITPTNTGIAARVFMGANVKTYFGFEFGASYYTPSEYEIDNYPNANQPHIWEYSADILGKIMYPLGPFSIFAKGGIGIVYKSVSSAIDASSDEFSNGYDVFVTPAYGFGVSYDITPRWVLDLSFMRIQGTDELENIDFTGLGISYHFVDEYCGQFLC
jgi:opacity protein-like surface antigen